MEPFLNKLAEEIVKLQLHPVADHFTVALLFVGVAIDLVANLAPTRAWLRYMALTLMILGSLAAGASYWTGGRESNRIWDALGQPAQQVLHRHGELGEYLAIAFGVLAVWRILIESVGFVAGSRGTYQAFAIVAIIALGYTSHLGGTLVYTYGAGPALMGSQPSEAAPAPAPPPSVAEVIPTVTMPTLTPTPSPAATPAPEPSKAAASPSPAAAPSPAPAHLVPKVSPTPVPSAKPTGGATL
ncbi:MAG TPA: DUF2231 domain-containing protein [Candidatus Binataceae bacterium]|nr:DUF2231 domain-containing protein [Candidatus Binataceae bacterium]